VLVPALVQAYEKSGKDDTAYASLGDAINILKTGIIVAVKIR
jgi:hypothetical protein